MSMCWMNKGTQFYVILRVYVIRLNKTTKNIKHVFQCSDPDWTVFLKGSVAVPNV
jgi:hypothetical protein